MHAHGMRNSNKILYGDQTRCGDSFYMVDHSLPWPKKFCDTNADTRPVYGR